VGKTASTAGDGTNQIYKHSVRTMHTVGGEPKTHGYKDAAYPENQSDPHLVPRRNCESLTRRTARYESRNKQKQETSQHSRSNSQTHNENSQSQLTQSNSQSHQA